jgi:serine phosphatase RsbU (regulator of sigma subunit)
MEPAIGSSDNERSKIGTRWMLNTYRVVPFDSKYGTIGPHHNGTTVRSLFQPFMMPPASAPPQDDVHSLLRERNDLHAQLFDAVQIQRKLSGPRVLRCSDWQFASEVFAARFLSGDFTTFSQDGSKVLAVLGDIAGKGVAAGMWFTHLAGLLQSCGRPDFDPARMASEINRHLCYLQPVAPFVTGFLAQIDCDLDTITYCNAGHFPPILLHADGRTELLEKGGPLLGALSGAEFQSGELMLGPGDTLVAYSDGVLECRNTPGEEFGLDRLTASALEVKQPSAQATLMMLLAAVQDFANGSPLSDDVSLTVIQRDAETNWS